MSNVNIMEVIRSMHGKAEGSEQQINAGTIIHSWDLFDEQGDLMDIKELSDKQVFKAYTECLKWMESGK